MIESVDVIEISWEGPLGVEEAISRAYGGTDHGVYQLYGTHNVLGPDTLLYIGKAQERPFARRISEHRDEWVEWEPSVVQVFLGRLGGTTEIGEELWPEWNDQISRAERLLILFCAPPYNSSGLKSLGDMRPTVVLNHRRRHRLPLEVSSLLWTTKVGTPAWRMFGDSE